MKKLLLLSLLLITALVFQSCKKIYSDPEEDLVPIAFSQTEITKASSSAVRTTSKVISGALVLGTSSNNAVNDWSTIYSSSAMIDGDLKPYFANGIFDLHVGDADVNRTFTPVVAYPISASEGVYIKALAPASNIADIGQIQDETGPTDNKVIFNIDGISDIMATGIVRKAASTQGKIHGYGDRTKPDIKLHFDRLLSKINFYIVADNAAAATHWKDLESITFVGGHETLEYNLTAHNITAKLQNTTGTGSFIVANINEDRTIPTNEAEHGEKLACAVMIHPGPSVKDQYSLIVKTTNAENHLITTNFKLPSFTYEKGCEYKMLISFSESVEIGFRVYITRWVQGTDGGVDI